MWKSVMALGAVALLSSACDGGIRNAAPPAVAQLSGKHGATMLYVTSGGNPNFAIYSFPAAKLLQGSNFVCERRRNVLGRCRQRIRNRY